MKRSRGEWQRQAGFAAIMDAREQPLVVCIGTQAADDVNLMSELVDYAGKVNSGEVVDETFHGIGLQKGQCGPAYRADDGCCHSAS